MQLTHSQISEIISNYTSSSEGFVTLQSLIMNRRVNLQVQNYYILLCLQVDSMLINILHYIPLYWSYNKSL